MAIIRYTFGADYDPNNYAVPNTYGIDTEPSAYYGITNANGRLYLYNARVGADLNSNNQSFNSGLYADFSGYSAAININSGGKADVLTGGNGLNTFYAGGGDDLIYGSAGTDKLDGETGVDTVDYSHASNGVTVYLDNSGSNTGDAAGDTFNSIERLIGTDYDDLLYGDAAANTLDGGAGNDFLDGGDGDDTLIVHTGIVSGDYEEAHGGDGTDTVQLTFDGNVALEANSGNIALFESGIIRGVFDSIEKYQIKVGNAELYIRSIGAEVTVIGDAGNSLVGDTPTTGDPIADAQTRITFDGGAGNDTYWADTGYDHIVFSGSGNVVANFLNTDVLIGSTTYAAGTARDGAGGIDTYVRAGMVDEVTSGSGNDAIYAAAGMIVSTGAGNDRIVVNGSIGAVDGGDNVDTLAIQSGNVAVTSVTNVERIVVAGDAALDLSALQSGDFGIIRSQSTAGHNVTIHGTQGADTIAGGAGEDVLFGEGGNDLISLTHMATVDGGAGDADTLSLKLAPGSLATFTDQTLIGVERVIVGAGIDFDASQVSTSLTITGAGGQGRDLGGGSAADLIRGSAGGEYLYGNGGDDTIKGGNGADHIVGGAGADRLFGENGADTFDFDNLTDMAGANGAVDRILDFNGREGDKINFLSLDANGDRSDGVQHFTFIGTDAFSGNAEAFEVRVKGAGANLTLQFDVNHDGVSDYSMIVHSTQALTTDDFLGITNNVL